MDFDFFGEEVFDWVIFVCVVELLGCGECLLELL